jgi:hypothetical protein
MFEIPKKTGRLFNYVAWRKKSAHGHESVCFVVENVGWWFVLLLLLPSLPVP